MPDNAAVVRRSYDAFSNHDLDAAVADVADGAEIVEVGTGRTVRGPEGMREILAGYLEAFPDSRVEITNLIEAGDWVVAEFTARGTHKGPLEGPGGAIPATGRSIEVAVCDVFKLQGGKVVLNRTYFDSASLLGQLGVLPEATAATS